MNIGYNTPLPKLASRRDAKFGRKSEYPPFFALQAVGLQPTKESSIPAIRSFYRKGAHIGDNNAVSINKRFVAPEDTIFILNDYRIRYLNNHKHIPSGMDSSVEIRMLSQPASRRDATLLMLVANLRLVRQKREGIRFFYRTLHLYEMRIYAMG